VSTVTDLVLSRLSLRLNANNRLVSTIRNTSFLSLKSGKHGQHREYCNRSALRSSLMRRLKTVAYNHRETLRCLHLM
jgi:hypothetical protein